MKIILMLLILIIIYILYKYYNLKHNLKRLNDNIIFREENNSLSSLNISTKDREFIKLYRKLDDLFIYINKKKIDYNKLSEENKKLMSNLSHDLRTPLTSIIGYLNLIKVDGENKEYLNIAKQKSIFLNELIEKFYELSLAMEDRSVEFEEFNLKELIIEESFNYFDKFIENNQSLKLDNLENIKIISNKKVFESILINLLDNMYKYSLGDNEILLKGNCKNYTLVFKNRVELEDGEYNELFERSKVLDMSRKNSTGIGLSIVKTNLENLKLNSNIYVKDKNFYIEIKNK